MALRPNLLVTVYTNTLYNNFGVLWSIRISNPFFNQQPDLILFTFSFINLNQHAKSSVIRPNVTENMKVKQSASIKMNTKTIQGPQSCDFAKLCTDFIRIKLSLTRKYHHKI